MVKLLSDVTPVSQSALLCSGLFILPFAFDQTAVICNLRCEDNTWCTINTFPYESQSTREHWNHRCCETYNKKPQTFIAFKDVFIQVFGLVTCSLTLLVI